MTDPIGSSKKLSATERVVAGFILIYGAVLFCLPVPYSEEVAALYPWWAKRIVVGNVQLHELCFIAWALFFGRIYLTRALLRGGVPIRQAALWLIALALWCGLVSLLSPLPFVDLGRTFRLLLNAALMLAVVRWTRASETFPLKMIIVGFFIGSLINFVISARFPLIVYQTMRLSGQNTPGVAMGIAVHLCAWLFYRSSSTGWRLTSVFTALTFAFGCGISYSRIGWFAGALGLASWGYVLLLARPRARLDRKRLARVRLMIVPPLVISFVLAAASPIGQQGLEWIQILAEQKFSGDGQGDTNRWAYVTGTAEIITRYPFGVGYSGFFDAMTATDTYRSGSAAEEESVNDANPHAAFLWYTTTGGVPAALISVLLFGLLLNSMRIGLSASIGRPGFVLFALIALPFVVIGLTVSYLFNSGILIIPAAIAAGWGWAARSRSAAEATAGTWHTQSI